MTDEPTGSRRCLRRKQTDRGIFFICGRFARLADPQNGGGAVISPLLANIYLHYVFDLWAEQWRSREATGEMIIVRYADDIVLGFQHEADARRFLEAMRRNLRKPIPEQGRWLRQVVAGYLGSE
jgi:RNA-directed DNA polymerase